MSVTPDQVAKSMLATLAVTCPALSCELGTPERKIIDAVAQAISAAYISNYLTGSLLDIETKAGLELDQFVGTFGFGRLQGKAAQGSVTIELNTPLKQDFPIKKGTQFYTKNGMSATSGPLYFGSTQEVVLTAGTYAVDIPVKCTSVGVSGNVAPDSITYMGSLMGSSSCTNIQSMTGGVDVETDEELRHRFENTLLRNVSGTEDWYKALCLQNNTVSRVCVYGPVSRYRTQVTAPSGTDSTPINVQRSSERAGTDVAYVWAGMEHVFTDLGQSNETFYNRGSDYSLSSVASPPQFQRVSGSSIEEGSIVDVEFEYTSAASRNDPINGVTNKVDVYVDGTSALTVTEATAITNTYIKGNSTTSSPYYASSTNDRDDQSPYYSANFERVGSTGVAKPGNRFTRLNSCPIISLPSSITIASNTYTRGTHYWLLKDTTKKRGSKYELSGIEWDKNSGPGNGAEVVVSYVYNQTPEVVSASISSTKQICTDVMVHQADRRYILPCFSIQYSHGYDISTVNTAITNRLQVFFQSLGFGAWIDSAKLCLAVQQILGVYSVRITNSDDDNINYGVRVYASSDAVAFDQELTNGTGSFKLADNQVAQFLSVKIRREPTP